MHSCFSENEIFVVLDYFSSNDRGVSDKIKARTLKVNQNKMYLNGRNISEICVRQQLFEITFFMKTGSIAMTVVKRMFQR